MSISRYDPVHDDAMVADEDGTHVRYVDHVQALTDLAESLGEQHEDARTAAVAAEREKWKAFADEKGEPRKVLGTLALTVEGDIIGDGAWCWFIFPGVRGKDDDTPARVMYKPMPIVDPDAYSGTRRIHSSRESALAAEAARTAKEQP